jgi:hypothetical protein
MATGFKGLEEFFWMTIPLGRQQSVPPARAQTPSQARQAAQGAKFKCSRECECGDDRKPWVDGAPAKITFGFYESRHEQGRALEQIRTAGHR